uniref:Exostosin GT47 domain-containing protein n=2 Tax=Calcidiscus leptoporus TaxID=127549 RepID=A0A6U5H9A2_9EUKA|mmetsp:Transcript_33015/g.77156  ORF Transcript_33015/g.77156 Transcript_33015/m.77156 type:complete len:440 (+) Transcript_33015:164-1483(+)
MLWQGESVCTTSLCEPMSDGNVEPAVQGHDALGANRWTHPQLSPDPAACATWALRWHAEQWRESNYLPRQLLRDFVLRETVELPPSDITKMERPSRSEYERRLSARLNATLIGIEDCTVGVVRIRQQPGCAEAVRIARAYRDADVTRAFFVLLGEEGGDSCEECQAFYAVAGLVVRHYHDPSCMRYGERVLTVPMGVADAEAAAWPSSARSLRASERRHAWSFASKHTNDARTQLVQWIRASDKALALPHLLEYPGEVPNFMRETCDSAFVLAPRGNVEDTWRVYEALHCGAIPVVTDVALRYWRRLLPAAVADELLAIDCHFSASPSKGRARDAVTQCSPDSFAREFDLISREWRDSDETGIRLVDARQARLMSAWGAYDAEWRARLRALAAGGATDGGGRHMLIGVMSTAADLERRAVMRDSWIAPARDAALRLHVR